MQCATAGELGAIGALFLLGIVTGCCFVTRMGDVIGRKPVYQAGVLSQSLLMICILANTSLYMMYLLCYLLGVVITARYYVGYTYLQELMPKDKQILSATVFFTVESIFFFVVIGYFALVSD